MRAFGSTQIDGEKKKGGFLLRALAPATFLPERMP
jgi:hypothetical protein